MTFAEQNDDGACSFRDDDDDDAERDHRLIMPCLEAGRDGKCARLFSVCRFSTNAPRGTNGARKIRWDHVHFAYVRFCFATQKKVSLNLVELCCWLVLEDNFSVGKWTGGYFEGFSGLLFVGDL